MPGTSCLSLSKCLCKSVSVYPSSTRSWDGGEYLSIAPAFQLRSYTNLSLSAFVGLAVLLILFPIPGYVAKIVQNVQQARLKRTDGRVQTVTESTSFWPHLSRISVDFTIVAMNVLRMVKLFGWEKKLNARIADKREEELVWIKKKQLLELLMGSLKCVPRFALRE